MGLKKKRRFTTKTSLSPFKIAKPRKRGRERERERGREGERERGREGERERERAHQDPRTLPILVRVRIIVFFAMFPTLLTPTRRTTSQQQPTVLPSTYTHAQAPHVTSHITPEAHLPTVWPRVWPSGHWLPTHEKIVHMSHSQGEDLSVRPQRQGKGKRDL